MLVFVLLYGVFVFYLSFIFKTRGYYDLLPFSRTIYIYKWKNLNIINIIIIMRTSIGDINALEVVEFFVTKLINF